MEDSIINLLANDNYIIVNRSLIKQLGLKETIILGELASEYNYYKKNDLLDEDGYFYSTIENIQENTTLSAYEQKKCLDNLNERNMVNVIIKGIPAKRHIKINSEQLLNLFANNLETSFQKIKKLDCEKFGTNNNKNNNNKKYNNNIYDFLQENGFQLTPIQLEAVNEWEDNELTRYAIKQAVLNNKYNISYIDKILYSYQKDNIKTVQQAIEKAEEFNKQKELYYKKKYEVKESRYEREKRILEEMCKDD